MTDLNTSKNPKSSPKKNVIPAKKRKVIIDGGAIEVFSNVGFDLASMDKIAEVAGVSKRTVYNHFESKDNLFQTIVALLLEGREDLKMITYDGDLSLESQLESFALAEIYLVSNPTNLKLSRILTSVFLGDITYALKIRMNYAPPHDALIQWLQEANDNNKLTINDTAMAARLFYSMVEGAITWPALFQSSIDEKAMKAMLDEIINTFMIRYKKTV